MASLVDFDPLAVPTAALWTAGVVLLLLTFVAARVISNSVPGRRPPVFEGIPFIGGLLKFVKGPLPLLEAGYARYGEVFTVPVLHRRITLLVGPHVTPHFFKATDEQISQKEVYEFNVPTFGPGVVYDVDHKVRAEQFRMFTEALKTARLKEYQPLFEMETVDFFGKWSGSGTVELQTELAQLITLTASRTLLGREIRENIFDEVSSLLHDLDAGMLPVSVLFPYLPIPPHFRRDKARRRLAEIYKKVIQSRRESGVREADLLQTFMESEYKNCYGGRRLNDEEVTGLLIAALFAGQHTSAITSSWTGYYMIHSPEWWAKVVEEQRSVMKEFGEEITYDCLQEMPVLHRCIQEALRLNPPLCLILRYVHKPFEVTTKEKKTFVIPKGDIVATSPTFNHRLSYLFPDPLKFEPDRFIPPRDEDKQTPFSYIAFGGGRHGCMGYNFAFLQIKTIWSYLIRNFEFKLVDPFPEPDYEAMVIGPKPCHVQYTRRRLTSTSGEGQ